MTQIMTPSDTTLITDGQIDKAVGLYRAMLEKHRFELGSAVVQNILGQPEFVGAMFGILRSRAEAMSSIITRRVWVPDRTLAPQVILDATGRKQYTDRGVVATMPRGEGEWVDVHFFKPDLKFRKGYINDPDLDIEFDLRGLKPVDGYTLCEHNKVDPAFADDRPNATHWKDADGKWCYAAFGRWRDDERNVRVDRDDRDWRDYWWFAGVSK